MIYLGEISWPPSEKTPGRKRAPSQLERGYKVASVRKWFIQDSILELQSQTVEALRSMSQFSPSTYRAFLTNKVEKGKGRCVPWEHIRSSCSAVFVAPAPHYILGYSFCVVTNRRNRSSRSLTVMDKLSLS